MHPIERLRYVARGSGASQSGLVHEAAGGLAAFGDDPVGLVTAARRILDRQPAAGAMWYLCARMLTSVDPGREAWSLAAELEADPTPVALADALPDDSTVCVLGWPELIADALPRRGDVEVLVVDVRGEGGGLVRRLARCDVDAVDVPEAGLGAAVRASDLVLLEAEACGPDRAVSLAGSLAAAAVGAQVDVPRWLVSGAGRLLPKRYVDAITDRLARHHDDPWDADLEPVPLALIDRLCGPAGPESVADGLRRISCPVAPELLVTL